MSIDGLAERGYAQLERGRYDQALATAEKLIRKGSVLGHDLKVQALLILEMPEDAMAAAEAGLEEHPDAWMLYNTLGAALMALERPEEALLALNQALSYDDAERAEVLLGIATAHAALDDWESTLEALLGNEDWGEYEIQRFAMQMSALVMLERWKEIMTFTDSLLAEMGDDLIEIFGPGGAAGVHAIRAKALLHGRQQKRRAENLAWDALRIFPKEAIALEVLRECAGLSSPFARQFALECVVSAGEEAFSSRYAVIADTLAEAFDFVVAFEARTSGGAPELVAHAEGEPMPGELCGIFAVGDEDDEEDDEGEDDEEEDNIVPFGRDT